jgi:hypothetical protein
MDLPTFSSIGPEIWGRSFWEFLDAIVATFPKENPSPEHKKAVYDLMHSLRYLLPCPTCRKHYAEFIQKHQLNNFLFSRKTFVHFYFLLRKDVALRTNKGFPIKTPDELFYNITRKLRLVKASPSISSRLHATQKSNIKSDLKFRVPRPLNPKILIPSSKGCGCGKK